MTIRFTTWPAKKQTMREFMHWSRGADPASYLGNEDDDLPMYFVSWSEATKFAQTLTLSAAGSVPLGYEFSLPTEAQWEYACRAGTTEATYAGPNDANVLDQIAWYDRNSAIGYVGRPIVPSHFGPRKIGLKKPNAWGLYDMQAIFGSGALIGMGHIQAGTSSIHGDQRPETLV